MGVRDGGGGMCPIERDPRPAPTHSEIYFLQSGPILKRIAHSFEETQKMLGFSFGYVSRDCEIRHCLIYFPG